MKQETDVNAEDAPRQIESDLNSLRVKVAKLCGWKFSHISKWSDRPVYWVPHDLARTTELPNYPSDLNACAEFEKECPDRRRTYMDALCAEVKASNLGSGHFDYADLEAVACATAEQRCRAFVAVMEGKK